MLHLDPLPLPARLFNAITAVEDQDGVEDHQLKSIGGIFVEYGMQSAFMIGILHRHVDLPENHILVHSIFADIDVCRIRPFEDPIDLLWPNSLLLNSDGMFQAYEYEDKSAHDLFTPMSSMTDAFLRRLRDYILDEHLENTVSLITKGPASVEYLLPDKQGTVSIPQSGAPLEDLQTAMTTAWSFEESDGEIITHAKYKCVVDEYGLHRRMKLPDS